MTDKSPMDGKEMALCPEHLCHLPMEGKRMALCLEHLSLYEMGVDDAP